MADQAHPAGEVIRARAHSCAHLTSRCACLQDLGEGPLSRHAATAAAAGLSGAALRAYIGELHDELTGLGFEGRHVEEALQVSWRFP